MSRYVVRRLVLLAPTLLGVSVVVFVLVRLLPGDPARVVASYAAKRVSVRPEHLGVERQAEYFEREADRLGHAPPVVDSADILSDPPAMLEKLCAALGVGWDPAMLRWKPGIRETDGIWASHWYDAVAASTGFGTPDGDPAELDDDGRRVADACWPYYEKLAEYRDAQEKLSVALTRVRDAG